MTWVEDQGVSGSFDGDQVALAVAIPVADVENPCGCRAAQIAAKRCRDVLGVLVGVGEVAPATDPEKPGRAGTRNPSDTHLSDATKTNKWTIGIAKAPGTKSAEDLNRTSVAQDDVDNAIAGQITATRNRLHPWHRLDHGCRSQSQAGACEGLQDTVASQGHDIIHAVTIDVPRNGNAGVVGESATEQDRLRPTQFGSAEEEVEIRANPSNHIRATITIPVTCTNEEIRSPECSRPADPLLGQVSTLDTTEDPPHALSQGQHIASAIAVDITNEGTQTAPAGPGPIGQRWGLETNLTSGRHHPDVAILTQGHNAGIGGGIQAQRPGIRQGWLGCHRRRSLSGRREWDCRHRRHRWWHLTALLNGGGQGPDLRELRIEIFARAGR